MRQAVQEGRGNECLPQKFSSCSLLGLPRETALAGRVCSSCELARVLIYFKGKKRGAGVGWQLLSGDIGSKQLSQNPEWERLLAVSGPLRSLVLFFLGCSFFVSCLLHPPCAGQLALQPMECSAGAWDSASLSAAPSIRHGQVKEPQAVSGGQE